VQFNIDDIVSADSTSSSSKSGSSSNVAVIAGVSIAACACVALLISVLALKRRRALLARQRWILSATLDLNSIPLDEALGIYLR
jgi:hypothetical protein